ncbi:hypothetical protein [Actinomadura chibensis]|uniref:Alpha/beta hydrolase n=1 Tax=Actinomadura chibensis TaxID=392828 RepID=A0A5D0NYU0_9ACTN|nr:hypothetical protein [Actinomadura chibensis]TYB49492.1 hypothetical protein FXF69_10560 [Actinomadura chibensis]
MTPGTLVLLHAPKETSAAWGDLPAALRAAGLDVRAPDVPDETGPRYIARAALLVGASGPVPPLVLVARGAAGPLLPGLALAQRAAHRPIGGYVFVDADLPHPLRHDHAAPENDVPMPPDWPEAPCGYLRTHPVGQAHDQALREAHLRGWPTKDQDPQTPLPQALRDLISSL